jgi:hypothetical protein
MMTLDDAWNWYNTTKLQLNLFSRLARKHWGELPWGGTLGNDDSFRDLGGEEIEAGSEYCLEHLDDFAVLLLFSVFESIVRDRVVQGIQNERPSLKHPHLVRIVGDALDGIEHGSFYRVLDVFKGEDPALVEEVNQVRRYRNWVAHGRRLKPPEAVSPQLAYERLNRFLGGLANLAS